MDKKLRLIDAVALVKHITKMPFGDMTSDQLRMVCRIHDMIIDAPTIKAEPVRHGRWVHCVGKSNLWYCSECGEKILYNPTRRTYNITKLPVEGMNKFCRKCGAKMDAKED